MKLDYPYCYDYDEVNSSYETLGENKMKNVNEKVYAVVGFVIGFLVATLAAAKGILTF